MSQALKPNVVVVIGARGIGLPIACHLRSGCWILLISYSPNSLSYTSPSLCSEGHTVTSSQVDVRSFSSVKAIASAATSLRKIDAAFLTSGVSLIASIKESDEIDLPRAAHVIETFLDVVEEDTSMICISSMAANNFTLSPKLENHLATASIDELLQHQRIDVNATELESQSVAYTIAKRGNQLRVRSHAVKYGRRRARINSVSPGVIMTKMSQAALDGPHGYIIRGMFESNAVGRIGTPEEVVDVVAFWLVYRVATLLDLYFG